MSFIMGMSQQSGLVSFIQQYLHLELLIPEKAKHRRIIGKCLNATGGTKVNRLLAAFLSNLFQVD
uniref:Uncharacterized protein n=1 Tax=Rhizophora mucronata TaxID=61149 RepID=A0A2P2J1K4_RHIMU